jgi:hypothetical protein
MEAREAAIASPAESVAMGLPEAEFGVIYAETGGERFTLVGDADFTRFLLATPASLRAAVEIPASKFPLKKAGW